MYLLLTFSIGQDGNKNSPPLPFCKGGEFRLLSSGWLAYRLSLERDPTIAQDQASDLARSDLAG